MQSLHCCLLATRHVPDVPDRRFPGDNVAVAAHFRRFTNQRQIKNKNKHPEGLNQTLSVTKKKR